MEKIQGPARVILALGMIGLGVLGFTMGDFAMQWQPVAAWVPIRTVLAYATATLEVACGLGLLFESTAVVAARILFWLLLAWVVLLKLPIAVLGPQVESHWLGLGETIVLFTGGWILYATLARARGADASSFLTSDRGIRVAQIIFAISLPPIGISHIIYVKQTAALVPAWLPPSQPFWAYLTGVGQIAAGLGMLFKVLPRAAVVAQAGMLTCFTLLVWIPALIATPTVRLPWTAFWISWVITAGAWVMASSFAPRERQN